MLFKTSSMDKTAFLLVFGAKLINIAGTYPDNSFEIDTPRHFLLYCNTVGLINWRQFMNKRRFLKRKTRKMAGLPERFTGDTDSKFTFEDLSEVIKLQKKEK